MDTKPSFGRRPKDGFVSCVGKRKDFKSSKRKTAAFAFTHCKLYTFQYRTAFAMVLEQLQKLREIDALYIEKSLYCKLFYTIQ